MTGIVALSRRSDPYQAKIVRRGVWQYLSSRAVQGILSFGVMLMLARYMPVLEYAAYVAATGAATLLAVLSKFGLDRVITRYLPEGRLHASIADLRRFLRNLRLLRLLNVIVLGVVLAACWPLASSWLKLSGDFSMLAAVSSFTLTHAFTSFQTINLQSLMLQKGLRNAVTASWLLRFASLLVLLGVTGAVDVRDALWVAAGTEFVGLLWMARVEAHHMQHLEALSSIEREHAPWPSSWPEIRRFAWHNYRALLTNLPTQGPTLRVLGAIFIPPHMLAAYGFYQTLADNLRVYLPIQLLRNLFEPVIMGKYGESQDFAKLNAQISTMLKLNLLILLPFASWFLVAGDGVIQILTAGKYVKEAWILPASALTIVATSHWVLLIIVANAVDASYRLAWGGMVGSLVALVVLSLSLPVWGVSSLILTAFLASSSANFVVIRGIRKLGFPYKVDRSCIIRMAFWAGAGGLIAWLALQQAGLERTLAGVLVAAVVVGGVFFLPQMKWKVFLPHERELLNKITGRIRIPF